MKKIILFASLAVALYSCKGDKKDMIARKWRAVSVANPALDSLIADRQVFLDTFGRNTDAETNEKIYGFRNVDSLRQSLKAEWKDMKDMQHHAVENTWFDFKKDGLVIMNFSGQADSSKWSIDKDGSLILTEPKSKPNAVSIKMEIVSLSDTSLKLRYNDNGGTSTVTFRPDSK